MSEQEVAVSVLQRINFLPQKTTIPPEAHRRLAIEFRDERLSRARVFA